MGTKEIPHEQRCVTVFERRGRGMRYVYARWRCKRKKVKGCEHCSYCKRCRPWLYPPKV